MAGQAILGDTVLKKAKFSGATVPGENVEALVAEHMLMVFRISWSILRNHHDAEDAVQECFLRVLKFQGRMHEVRNSRTWLARIAWTTALDRRSHRAVVAGGFTDKHFLGEEALAALPDLAMRVEQEVANRQMRQILERLIAALPPELRDPLELSTVQELNSAEIAEIMNIPPESVRTRLLRARHILKAKLASLLEVKKHG